MKRILIQAGKHPYTVPTPESSLLKNTIRGNVGNLMYTNAAFRHLSTPGSVIEVDEKPFRDLTEKDAGRINESCDIFVIPMANAFKSKFVQHLHTLANVIRNLKVPVVVFGIGAQASLKCDVKSLAPPVDDAVKSFIGAVLDRSASVGVRGEFTLKYLNHLGFSNIDVIGCPSVFMNGRGFQVIKKCETLPSNPKIALSSALKIRDVDIAASINESLLHRYPRLTYFAQQSSDLSMLYWGDSSVDISRRESMPVLMSHPLMQGDVCMPLEPHGWIRALAEYDFSIGTRIHGNVAALVAGTPAFVIAHDSRTLELARYHRIPHRVITDMKAGIDPERLYAEADFADFNAFYDESLERLLGFMTKNNLENTYDHGDGGAEYDRRVTEANFPGPYGGPLHGLDSAAIAARFTLLHERILESAREDQLRVLEKRVKLLQSKLDSLQKSHAKHVKSVEVRFNRTFSVRAKHLIKKLLGRARGKTALPPSTQSSE